MKNILLVAVAGLFLFSCKKDGCMDNNAYNFNHDAQKDNGSCLYDGTLQVNVTPKFKGAVISFDSVYHNISGYRIKFSSIKFYTTTTQVSNGSNVVAANSVSRFNYAESKLLFSSAVRPGSYKKIGFNIGVDSIRNHSDPAAYAPDSPLNIINSNGMFWTWNSGYIFVIIEGQYDTDSLGTAMPTINFSYHLGKDEFLKWNSQLVDFSIVEGMTTQLNYELNMESFFYDAYDTLDIDVEPIIHSTAGQSATTEFLSNNFNRSLVLE